MNRRAALTLAGIILAAAAAGVAGGLVMFRARTPVVRSAPDQMDARTYALNTAFVSTTNATITTSLLTAFHQGLLFEPMSWNVAGASGTKLIAASPTTRGHAEALECGGIHPYCGLYLVTPTTTTLPIFGDDMTGFGGVLGFPDADHARVGYAWSALGYLEVRQDELNLQTGLVREISRLEFDTDQQWIKLSVIVRGVPVAFVNVDGTTPNNRFIPRHLNVTDGSGKQRSQLSDGDVAKLTQLSTDAPSPVPPLSPYKDYAPDLPDKGTVNIAVFGKMFKLDVNAGTLTPMENF